MNRVTPFSSALLAPDLFDGRDKVYPRDADGPGKPDIFAGSARPPANSRWNAAGIHSLGSAGEASSAPSLVYPGQVFSAPRRLGGGWISLRLTRAASLRLCVLAELLAAALLTAQTPDLLEQADTAFRAGNTGEAASLAGRALARDPGSVNAHMILGVIAAQNNDWPASDRHFQAVIRLEPSNPYGYFYLGQSRLYQQQWDAAAAYFNKALAREYPERERLLVELALAQHESGHPGAALATLAKIAPPADEHLAAQYHAVAAFAQGRLNRPGAAIDAIRRALALDETNSANWDFLISALIQTDQAPQALAEAIRAQKRFPDHPDIQFLFALASYYVNESPLSKLALRNLREAEPGSPRVLLAEGLLYRKQGNNDQATTAFREAAARGVNDAHLLLGIVYKENGDYDAAEREYREAERLNPRSGQALLELGKLFLARGRLEDARLRLEKAAELIPGAPAVHYQLGLLYRRLGDAEKSKRHLELARQAAQ